MIFGPVYVEPSQKITKLIKKAVDLCPSPKLKTFSYLSGRTYQSIWEYINGKHNIPLFVVLKACNILEINPWKILNGLKLYSRNKRSCLTFKKNYNFDVNIIIDWIKLEGTISLSSSHIYISQSTKGEDALIKLQEIITSVFKSEVRTRLDKPKTRPGMSVLYISSAPLRQVLVLKYGARLGYKSRKIESKLVNIKKLGKEQIIKTLATCFETEGSFIHRKKTKYHTGYCEFVFSCFSEKYTKNVKKKLEFLGFTPSFRRYCRRRKTIETEYRIVIRKYNELVRLCFGILPYICHKGKILDIVKGLLEENYMSKCKVLNSPALGSLIRKVKQKIGTYKRLTKYISKHTGIVRDDNTIWQWSRGKYKVPLAAVWTFCKLVNKDWKRYIPKYFSLILWLNGLISREEIENVRGLNKGSFAHVESIRKKLYPRLNFP